MPCGTEAEVVAAARDHARVTGRRVSYEYVMISGVNDTDADADALARLLRGDLAHVNLIPMNPVAPTPWKASAPERVAQFAALVRHRGIGVTIRANRGQDAGAACGQLAADRAGEPAAPAVAHRREEIVRQSEAALLGNRSADGVPAEGQIAVVGLYGESIKIGYGSQGGWDAFGLEREITGNDKRAGRARRIAWRQGAPAHDICRNRTDRAGARQRTA